MSFFGGPFLRAAAQVHARCPAAAAAAADAAAFAAEANDGTEEGFWSAHASLGEMVQETVLAFCRVDRACHASTSNHVAQRASITTGNSLLRIAITTFPEVSDARARPARREATAHYRHRHHTRSLDGP